MGDEHVCQKIDLLSKLTEKVRTLESETDRTRNFKGEVMKEIEQLRVGFSNELQEVKTAVGNDIKEVKTAFSSGILRITLLIIGVSVTGLITALAVR